MRKVVDASHAHYDSAAPFAREERLGDALLTPTRLYVKSALAAIKTGGVKGLAHITGGGITDNLPRVLPETLEAEIDLSTWRMPAVFEWLMKEAALDEHEMLRTFNCGLGLIAVVEPEEANAVVSAFNVSGECAMPIGRLMKGAAAVRYTGALG